MQTSPTRRHGSLLGYAEPLIVRPGEPVEFKVSAEAATYDAQIVRLIHGDENPDGPGYKEDPVATSATGTYPGRVQRPHTGSYVLVPHSPLFPGSAAFTVQAWVYPTTPDAGRNQGIVTHWSGPAGSGFQLLVGVDGDLTLVVGDGAGHTQRICSAKPMLAGSWYFVAAVVDPAAGLVRLEQEPLEKWPLPDSRVRVDSSLETAVGDGQNAPLLIGAGTFVTSEGGYVEEALNGKVDRPRLFGRALTDEELGQLQEGRTPTAVADGDVIAAWDFSADIGTDRVTDSSANRLDGTTVNAPDRAVTGHNWAGDEVDWRRVPEQYGAIYFHHDDLEDARWETDFTLVVPDDTRSGIYAARLTGADGIEDHVPFIVVPKRRTATIAFLAPTMTYIAYSNSHLHERLDFSRISGDLAIDPMDIYLEQHPELGLSAYDLHADGSPVMSASWKRPIPNLRPKYRMWWCSGPEHLGADLYLIDWLENKEFDYDVITDHTLHSEGAELLAQYRVIVTGGHPEYWTTPMRDSLQEYLNAGGRLMYTGGNGFYWVTAVDAQRPHMVEVRRGNNGIRSLDSAPGEVHTNATGEMAGLWRYRGWAPQRVTGVGTTAQGFDMNSPGYRRRAESFDERASFIFEGVDDDATIGDSALLLGGAAANEIDRTDPALGTPPHALRVASSEGLHGDIYQLAVEDLSYVDPAGHGGTREPRVRADMVYFEGPAGGAVFSVGSVNWYASLSQNNYENAASKVMANVLNRFSS